MRSAASASAKCYRAAALHVALGVCVACKEIVVLGTECPQNAGVCHMEHEALDARAAGPAAFDGGDAQGVPATPGSHDAATEHVDAGVLDGDSAGDVDSAGIADSASDIDSADITDAATDPVDPTFFLKNPSFESLSGASVGELSISLNGQSSPITPWYACRSGLQVVRSARGADGSSFVSPRNGSTFLIDSFPNTALNFLGLAQDLNEPLTPQARYAFVVELYSINPFPNLTNPGLVIGAGKCLAPALPLASSGPIAPGAWQTVCIAFTAPAAVETIMLYVDAPRPALNDGVMLFIDNIRTDPSCQ